ncbi:MAG: hypothetical protein KGH63_02145 [Candidatus Micrarchaeota archaeon]|nr:hypothetical protein [Candidatus Micrarchaeota archaeon]
MWTLEGPRGALWDEIAAHPLETEVRIKTKPSKALFLRLLDGTKVQQIHITAGLWKTVPDGVKAALEKAGIKVVMVEEGAGRPAQYDEMVRKQAVGLLQDGKTAKEISIKLNVPTTAIFYWKRQMKQEGKTEMGGPKIMSAPDST